MDNDTLRRIAELTHDIRILHSADNPLLAEDFVALCNSIYARKISHEYFSWRNIGEAVDDGKVCKNPVNGSMLLAYQGSLLLGACGYIILKMNGEPDAAVGLVIDLMVTPSHQKVGLVATRLRYEVERALLVHAVKAIILFPNPQGAQFWLGDQDARLAGELVTFVAKSSPDIQASEIGFEQFSQFEHWVDDVAASFARTHSHLAMVRRDSNYLNWRFVRNPVYSYELFRASRSGIPLGYIVLKVFRDPKSKEVFGDIVDVLWAEQDRDLAHRTLRFALSRFHQIGVGSVATWLQPNTLLHDIGHRVGFVSTSQRRAFCVTLPKGGDPSLADATRWYLTMSDSEVY